jgi:hypothetical protein
MPRNKPKPTKALKTETKPAPPPPLMVLKRKLQFRELQLALLARALKPADFPFNPITPDDVRALQVELMHRHLQRVITPDDFAMCNQAVRNLREIICPRPIVQVIQTVTQNVDVAAEAQRSKQALLKLDDKGRDAVYEYIATMATDETGPLPSQP